MGVKLWYVGKEETGPVALYGAFNKFYLKSKLLKLIAYFVEYTRYRETATMAAHLPLCFAQQD